MSRIIVSGGTGYVGRFIVDRLLADGQDVVLLSRGKPEEGLFLSDVAFQPHSLADQPVDSKLFAGCDVFIHAAFHHEAGRYRGGEGQDPLTFQRLNHDGSMALFHAAKSAGVARAIFLSSRAVYGNQSPGELLFETTEPNLDSLYGKVKLRTEQALLAMEDATFLPLIVRATGVYGASANSTFHKWLDLFKSLESGDNIEPRIGTEVHGEDLAAAVSILLQHQASELEVNRVFNVSDILLDRRDLLEAYAIWRGLSDYPLPASSDSTMFNPMDCSRMKKLGWAPRGNLDLSWLDRA